MIEKINPTIPIPIESSSIPDEQREITIAKSSIAIPNPIFFIVNPSFEISNWTKSLSLLKIISLENYVVILFQTLFLMKSIFFHKKRPGTEIFTFFLYWVFLLWFIIQPHLSCWSWIFPSCLFRDIQLLQHPRASERLPPCSLFL